MKLTQKTGGLLKNEIGFNIKYFKQWKLLTTNLEKAVRKKKSIQKLILYKKGSDISQQGAPQ